MFKKILIANRGAAAKLNCMARGACAGDCIPMEKAYV
jgi:hypothetical protein